MTAGELVVVLAAVLLSIGFAALVVVLLRVLDAVRDLRGEVVEMREQTRPLIDELRESAHVARQDLERFDKVLGSAEAIGDAVGSTVARSAYSSPAIKAAGVARGAGRTWSRLRGRPVAARSTRGADVIDVRRGRAEIPREARRRA
ncbi:hypothetical protein [Ilumatobacter sp.]|uniref:hypothetical protein n=1 Tax=Ilumatobacter sp. TaxID=1967498 RepID=UPI003B51BE27